MVQAATRRLVTEASLADGIGFALILQQLQEQVRDANSALAAALDESYSATMALAGVGIDPTGAADSTLAVQAKLATAVALGVREIQVPEGSALKLSTWTSFQVTNAKLVIRAKGPVSIAGPSATTSNNFMGVGDGGSVIVDGDITWSNFLRVIAPTSTDTAAVGDIIVRGSRFSGSASGGLVVAIPSTKGPTIERLFVVDCDVSSCRQGVHVRARVKNGYVMSSKFSQIANYAVRFGQDWEAADWMGSYWVLANFFIDLASSVTGSGNETDAVALFGDFGIVFGNVVRNVTNASNQDCEGVYSKLRSGVIFANNLQDAGRDEGSIVCKMPKVDPANTAGIGMALIVVANIMRFTTVRDYSVGVSVQRHNVLVALNEVDGYGVNGIRVSWRSAYHDISIFKNKLTNGATGAANGGARAAAIAVWFYGYNVNIEANEIDGAPYTGIAVITNASGDTRYPDSDTPVCRDLTVNRNIVRGTGQRGIEYSFNGSTPVTSCYTNDNIVKGFTEYSIAWNAAITFSSVFWLLNNLVDRPMKFFGLPASLTVDGPEFRRSASATWGSGSATVTIPHGIQSDVAAKLARQDFSPAPGGSWGAITKWWVESWSTTTVTLRADQAPGSSVVFSVKTSIDRVLA